jgi:hypothetical protein
VANKPDVRSRLNCTYDVCLSFAGEDRKYVRQVADALRSKKSIRVFYDQYEKANLWGRDLYTHLDYVYGKAALYCVIFLSDHYAKKLWTSHERRSAQARAFSDNSEYILPARFDDSEVPGILPTTGYVDLRHTKPEELATLISQKLLPFIALEIQDRSFYLPPDPDHLYKATRAKNKIEREIVWDIASHFVVALSRMSDAERFVILNIFLHSCSHDAPENVHIDIDLLQRITKLSRGAIGKSLLNLTSLGFTVTLPKQPRKQTPNRSELIYMKWGFWSSYLDKHASHKNPNFTGIAIEMVGLVARHYCQEHAIATLMRANFSSLSSATAVPDVH